ncbi:MAG: zinc dependent phospholipase C family protein [Clostridia bacterium]|nr:zinc dependent phospholipase C family protein [Clostridia bacterium]
MASWMIHFRVAQAMLDRGALGECPERAPAEAFVMGNIAPDSGVPTPEGGYSPDKNTSHFMRRFEGVPAGQNPERCDPHLFAREWLIPALDRGDKVAAAFYLGYLCHLVTDNGWVRDFIYPAKVRFAHLRLVDGAETPEGVARFYAFLKRDWYDMDFLYLRRHSDLPAYRLFLDAPRFENEFLPFFPADAFEVRRSEIEAFYRKGVAAVEERSVYISEDEAEAFIERVADEILGDFGDLFGDFCSKLTSYSQI